MRKHLRSATALALVTGLAVPGQPWAQDLPQCEEGVDLPCLTEEGNSVETPEALEVYLENIEQTTESELEIEEAPVEELPVVDAPADAEGDAADPSAMSLPQCEEGAELPCRTDEGNTVETPEALEVYLENVEEATESELEIEEAPVEELPVVDAPEESPEEVEAEEAPPEAPAEDASAEPVDDTADEETAGAAEGAGPAATEEAVESEPVTEEAAEPAVPEEPAVAPEEVEAPQAPAEATGAPETVAQEDPVPEDTVEGDIPVVESEVPENAEQAEEPPLAAAAATADETTAPPAEVEEMTITDDMARSSAEEFTTAIGQEAPVEGDDGPTRLERALALGIGAAVLGTILEQGSEVVSNTGDRVVVRQQDGDLRVIRDDDVLLRQPGADVRTETFDDGSTRTTVTRDDGVRIITIRAADGEVLRRTRILPDGRRVVLFDQTGRAEPVDTATLPAPTQDVIDYTGDEDALRAALARAVAQDVGRNFSLRQIREIRQVRELAPEIVIDEINFPTGSAVIQATQAQELAALGRTLAALIEENPSEVFLVEGHTDTVGDESYNLALSDRRAESVALALTEYFDVPPENLVVQGYGESDLKIPTAGPERQNRRANVRRITGLLGAQTASLR